MVKPVELTAEAEQRLGVASSLLAVGMATFLAVATVRACVALRGWLVIRPLSLVAMFFGFAYRVVTAAVIGAKMAGGMLVLVGPPFLWALLVTASKQWQKVHGHA